MTNIDEDDVLRSHAARNAALIRELATRGVDLDSPRAIEHHFWAEGHRSGVQLASALYQRGFLLLVLARVATDDASGDLWNVEAEVQQSVNDAAGTESVVALVTLASSLSA